MKRVQFYLAATKEEYDEALSIIRSYKDDVVTDVREVGLMITDVMDTYVFLFVAEDKITYELSRKIGVNCQYINDLI